MGTEPAAAVAERKPVGGAGGSGTGFPDFPEGTAGSSGSGGAGGSRPVAPATGGGGGGGEAGDNGGGGGGGSSFAIATATNVTHQQSVRTGNGQVIITYSAQAFWDGDGSGAVGGGAGTWDTSLARWSSTAGGSNYAAWDNAANDDAVFQNTAGTVTIGAAVTARSITFGVTGYTLSGASAITLAGGGTGVIATGAFDATISAPIAGAMSPTKTGTGMLTLSGTNTYTGTTSVAAGTLRVDGSIAAASTVAIQTGATIAGTGTIGGSLAVADNAVLAPGRGGIGTLAIAHMTWHGSTTGATTASFELSNTDDTSDRLAVTDFFNKGSGTTFRFDFAGTGAAGNIYTLATFASTTFAAGDFSFTNLAPGLGGAFSIVNGTELRFEVAAPPVINSATTASGTYRNTFTYTITATNSPTTFSVTGTLPARRQARAGL